MKNLNKVLSVGLSLVLCAGMVVPAFAAASFDDLQRAITDGAPYGNEKITGTQIGDTGRYGYGNWLNEEKTQYEIEAWDEGGTRNVQLNADVKLDKNGADVGRDNGITVWRPDEAVSIELNGHTIDMNPDFELDVEKGEFVDKDGNAAEWWELHYGTVITVTGGANLTVKDSSGTGKITGGNAWNVTRNPDGTIKSYAGGTGAVYVDQNSSFTMEGGSVSGNRSQGPAICAENTDGAKNTSNLNVTLKGVTVDNNYTKEGGTIYFRAHAGTVNADIEGCTITGNVAEGDVIDFGIYGKGQSLNAKIEDTTITGNRVDKDNKRIGDHGGVALWEGDGKTLSVTFDGCTIQDNEGGSTGIYYDNQGSGNGLVITEGNNTICGNGQPGDEGTSVTYRYGKSGDAMHTDAYWETIEDTTEPEIIKEATYTEPGSIRYTCPLCGAPHVVETPVKTPDVIDEDNKDGDTPDDPIPGGSTPNEYRPAGGAEAEVEDTGIEIEDEAVPLAGIFTRADAIGYLWEKTGKPDAELSDFPDVPENHYWAVAIGWAQDMGIALADKDGNFRPDDLVLRSVESLEISPEGELQEFLNRYAVFAGIELDADELFIELEGSWDDVIMGEDAQVIFDDFFARLEEALADIAA